MFCFQGLLIYGVYGFLSQILKVLSLSLVSAAVPDLYLLESDTSNSNGSPVWKMPTALVCFTSRSVFLKESCFSDLQSHVCPFFTRKHKGQMHCAK